MDYAQLQTLISVTKRKDAYSFMFLSIGHLFSWHIGNFMKLVKSVCWGSILSECEKMVKKRGKDICCTGTSPSIYRSNLFSFYFHAMYQKTCICESIILCVYLAMNRSNIRRNVSLIITKSFFFNDKIYLEA